MNTCLVDAVVYAGAAGEPIREAIRSALCAALGGEPSGGGECRLPEYGEGPNVALVAESLGSKILFDTVRELYEVGKASKIGQPRLQEELAAAQYVYMVSNQIALLDRADETAAVAKARKQGRSASTTELPASSLSEFLRILRSVRVAKGPRLAALPPITVVNFTDPNDLLSYRLLPEHIGSGEFAAHQRDRLQSSDLFRLAGAARPRA